MVASGGRVRDPVHDYIAFTAIERTLFDHPVAQRLRHVSQSAAAHLVFPEMRVSRFAHSLGAMHLASSFFAASLRNAAPHERGQILGACSGLVARHEGLGVGDAARAILSEPALVAGPELPPAQRAPVLFVEQALRLASLVHDLGHLPFSHDFETALEARIRVDNELKDDLAALYAPEVRGKAIHEKVGYALAASVQQRVFVENLVGTEAAKLAEVAFLIARDILDAPAAPELENDPVARVVGWLHSLIDGEIDVDRADYVLRDVRAYGLAAAVYDHKRLTDSLVPVTDFTGAMVTATLPPGVSDAEAFLVARYRMYAWAIFHHKIQQAAAGLRIAIEDVLEHSHDDVKGFLDAIAGIASGDAGEETLLAFAECDDVWFTQLMRRRLDGGPPAGVQPWSALFLRRRPGPVSLWKRPSDFPVDRAPWNARLPGTDDTDLQREWDRVAAELRAEGLVVHRLRFRPWDARADGESELQVWVAGEPRPLTVLAPLVRALDAAWADQLQVHVYAGGPEHQDPASILRRLDPALHPPQETP